MKLFKIACGLSLGFILLACSETSSTSAPAAPVAALPTPTLEEPAPELTATLPEPVESSPETTQPVAEAAAVDWLTVEGVTENNLAYLGNPEAPITLIDYSDFL